MTPTSASWRSARAEVEPVGFHELLERSDFLSIHAPLNVETEHAIDAAALSRMKPTAAVINTARGPIIDEAGPHPGPSRRGDRRGRPRRDRAGAGLPGESACCTWTMCVVTPHIASASNRMRPETRRRVGREVSLVLRGRWPMSCVNPTVLPRVRAGTLAALSHEQGTKPMNVATAIARAMKAEGVDILFAYPVNPLIEAAAREDIRTVIVRQERTGLHMADAYSRVTSGAKIGVFCMQHGPGAENAFGGVAQAFSESVPIMVVPAGYPRRLANHYPNFNSSLNMRHVTKWAEPLTMGRTIPDVMRRAFFQLRNGRPGPVLIEVPADVWNEEVPDDWVHTPSFTARTGPDPAAVADAAQVLAGPSGP